MKGLIIASLCHDIDHYGLTNAFLQLVEDDIAQLYETSALENHHWTITKMLLDTHVIFTKLSEQGQELLYKEIQKYILATDLSVYFQRRAALLKLLNPKTFSWKNATHRLYIKSLMMTACDFSELSKPFLTAKRITDEVYRMI